MAFSKMMNPKKKRRVHAIKDSPFPVPIAIQEQTNDWYYYTGYLHDNHVEIKHSGDIDRLYKMVRIGLQYCQRHSVINHCDKFIPHLGDLNDFWCFNATQQYFSYIMTTSFSGGRSRSTRREPPTMGK